MLALLATLHLGISAGIGASHDIAGPRLELRLDHFAVTAAWSPFQIGAGDRDHGERTFSMALGARWFLGEDGDRFFVSGQYAFVDSRSWTGPYDDPESVLSLDHASLATVTAGWRWKWSGFFIDAGAGGGLYFDNDDRFAPHPFPDLTLALGWEF